MKIFLDLDGVLVDWSGGLCKLLNIDPYDIQTQRILRRDCFIEGGPFGSIEEVNKVVDAAGYDFWMNLELLPWSDAVIELCKSYTKEVYFLTSYSNFHAAGHAKLDYIEKHFKSDKVVLTKHKYLCANAEHLLIDDMLGNIQDWTAHGGIPFHWPCQWLLRENLRSLDATMTKLDNLLSDWHRFETVGELIRS